MRQFLQWRAGHAALLGEANVTPKYFGDGRDGLNMMFNFFVNQVDLNQQAFIDAFAAHVLPQLR